MLEVIQPLIDKLQDWMSGGISMLPNLLVAIGVLVGSFYVARLVRVLTRRGLDRVSDFAQINSLIATLSRIAVICAGIFIALGVVNLDRTVTSLLAGVGIIGLALGFAFQDLATNLIAGVYLAFRRPFTIGELVELSGHFGTVKEIQLRATTLRRLTGQHVLIPNKDIFHDAIINFSRSGLRRVDVQVGVSYDDDLSKARAAAMDALESMECRVPGKPCDVFYESFGGSSIDMVARFWIAEGAQRDYMSARSEAIMAIKQSFDRASISIPFPIRTLDLPDGFGLSRSESSEPAEAADSSALRGESKAA